MPKSLLIENLKDSANYIIDIIDGKTIIPRSELEKTLAIEQVVERMLADIENFRQEVWGP